MSTEQVWCGIHRCCREANHPGACEVDILELEYQERAVIEALKESQ